jgi:glycosyltransferase involved in cell wall biosynthesis
LVFDALMKLAISILCENPFHKTGLTTTYHAFVARSLKLFPEVSWIVFAGPNQDWRVADPRVEVVRRFPANDQLKQRLMADHFQVPPEARARGADFLLTTGFVPVRKSLPIVMNVFFVQHLDRRNRVGFAREWYRRWATRRWPKADLVIANSRFAASQILDVFPELHERLIQSYEGLQHEQFKTDSDSGEMGRLRTQLGLEPGYILWMSNFHAYKQASLLLAGYARLDEEFRRRHPLVLVGGDWNGHRAAAQRQAHALGLKQDAKFTGWVDDELLAPLFRQAVAHVLPSREETFGRTVIESMACGTPVVVNDIPIMREITAGQALMIDFNDAAGVANALVRVAQDDVLRTRLRAGGLARAQDFTFEKFATERINAIQQLVHRAGV